MVIRKIKKEDRQEVFDMMRVFYDSDVVIHTAPNEILYKVIDDCLSSMPFIEGYLFEEDGEIAGYSMVSTSYTTEYGGLCLWIEDIFIKEDFRGRGIGSDFFQFLEETYADKVVRFKLEVELENEKAISVYKRAGYEKLGYSVMSKEKFGEK